MWWRWQRELVLEMREENRAHHAELRALRTDQRRRFDAIDAAMENDKRVTRDIILELREGRERDRDLRDEMRAKREGLLQILDEMRRADGRGEAA